MTEAEEFLKKKGYNKLTIQLISISKTAELLQQYTEHYHQSKLPSEEVIYEVLESFRAKCREADGSLSYGFILPSEHKKLARAILTKIIQP